MKSQDLLILEKLKIGDSTAYKELFDLYYMPLSIYSLKYCDSFDLAEDIVQGKACESDCVFKLRTRVETLAGEMKELSNKINVNKG